MRLGDGARAIILVGLGIGAIVIQGTETTAEVLGIVVGLLIVALLLELTVER